MKTYEVSVDVQTTFRCSLEASNEMEAREKAEKLAYQDTWSCKATWGGFDIYGVEEVSK